MKISFKWLNDYIDISDFRNNAPELARKLTQAGLEVEGIVDQKQAFQNVVIGHLLAVDKHPDADKLTVCKVNTGEPEPRQIVCGATNHKAGDYVVAALPGALLPGDFAIKKSKIRGVESLGMLCSESELGLKSESQGILTLKSGEPGAPFAQAFGLDDVIFEINVTPNRADCLSHRGLAYELSALLDRPFRAPEVKLPPTKVASDAVKVVLEAAQACPRYSGARIDGVKVGESPQWLKQRLTNVGMRSINNIVDVTNYIMFDFGQPMHAFDFDKLQGGELVIRFAKNGEPFKALDDSEYKLNSEELVIADKNRVVALAGVIGGLDSGTTTPTKSIFLESAFFAAQTVRRTARARGIETDSAYRFARGVNPEHTVQALQRAIELVLEVAGGTIASEIKDLYPTPIKRESITITVDKVENRLGYKVDKTDFHKVLQRLGCAIDGDKVTAPAHRWDLSIPEDLVEEYARINGYEKVIEKLPVLSEEPTTHTKSYLLTRRLSSYLSQQGLSQAVNYAFLNPQLQKNALGDVSAVEVPVQNPVSEDFGVLRISLLPSLLNNVSFNVRHGNDNGDTFEIAPTVQKNGEEYAETLRLGFAFWGQATTIWGGSKIPAVYRLKSYFENLLMSEFPGEKYSWDVPDVIPPLFHPKQCVALFFRGKKRGVLGAIHPQLAKEYKLKMDVAFAEFPVDEIFSDKKVVRYKEISAHPGIERDAAFILPQTVKAEAVKKEIAKTAGDLLKSIAVIDKYEGPPLKENERSVAFRLYFQKSDRTLADEEVNQVFKTVLDTVQQKLPITLR